jgi:hypothetical protein
VSPRRGRILLFVVLPTLAAVLLGAEAHVAAAVLGVGVVVAVMAETAGTRP